MGNKKPKDSSARVIGADAKRILIYQLKPEKCEQHEQTGVDCGIDIAIDVIKDEEFSGKIINGQIKGTKNLKKNNGIIKYDFDVKTINYGINQSNVFVLFLVDVTEEIVYFIDIQDYLINHVDKLNKLRSNNCTLRIEIDENSNLTNNSDLLYEMAFRSYYYNEKDNIIIMNS